MTEHNGSPVTLLGLGEGYLDAGIMAIPPMIATPAAFVLYSGSPDVFEAHRTTLERFGAAHHLGTDPGLAALHDIALLSGMYGMMAGVLHAYALVRSTGGEVRTFAPMLDRWLTAMRGFLAGSAEQIDKADYTIGVVSNLGMQAAGFPNLIAAAEDQGVSPELLAPLGELMRRRAADGHGHEDIGGVIELLGISEKPDHTRKN